jgi:hypothetical protein
MGLQDAIERLTFRVRPLPEQSAIERLAISMPTDAPMEQPPHIDLDDVAGRFIEYITRGTQISLRDWNKAAWCLWMTKPAIAEHDRALNALLARVGETISQRQRRPYHRLASAYLTQFAADRKQIGKISGVLRGHAEAAGEPWNKLQAKYAIFDGAKAVERIAHLALDRETNIQNLLRSEGIRGLLLEAAFAEAVHGEGLKILRTTPVIGATDRIDTVRQWSLDSERLIFERCKSDFARAVVLPFGHQATTRTDRDLISNFIIGRFGDPRINRSGWIGMDDVADILRRWLTEQSLLQFLDVVDQITLQDTLRYQDVSRTWKYRRALWLAYHKAELIQNAWVVFGEDGAAQARRAFGKEAAFGKFIAGGRKQILPGHAVLLLDFGSCIVADWSHNGRCNIWRKSDPTRPKDLYAPGFTTDQIMRVPQDDNEADRNSNDIFSHLSSENYVWQDRVAKRLAELIGVRIPQSAYQVH